MIPGIDPTSSETSSCQFTDPIIQWAWDPGPRTRPTVDRDTFHAAYGKLAAFHDELWERTEIEPSRTVLGGFSMGSVMSYALSLGSDRPPVAGILAFSGFIPTVEGWEPDVAGHLDTRVFITHGRHDPIMDVGFARQANALLSAGGLDVEYHESDAGHHIDPSHIPAAIHWL